ncbi:MAG: tRNA (adenosine(37)-N6)-dimethylallyltransferase MiaA [Bacteroidetes bacterium]|nr:tRNA (adenosine(37)-N6)-dimethylallyltransferase MiaA [Bacteroidota bacterium]MBU1797378.1 tRNA (adenosine(37)-N6)-dimethylallyltransferase MiaA [Bacteroidota bacterium]
MLQKLIVILGPTAVGKTKFAVQLAHKFNGEIISADSRQVYKTMDIGTGKDLAEYTIENSNIPFHLIDIVNPNQEYNLFSFQNDFYNAINKIVKNKTVPFLTGGTGLYIHSILKNYKLEEVDFNSKRAKFLETLAEEQLEVILNSLNITLHNVTDSTDKERLLRAILVAENKAEKKYLTNLPDFNFETLVIGIGESREIIRERITTRLKNRLENGMIEEVNKLIESGITYEKLDYFGLEYKYIGRFIKGESNYNDMFQRLNTSIHQFAKRQMTWFRKMEKEGININWLKFDEIIKAETLINNFLK